MPMIVEKIRLRFRKAGAMRLVSHHDLMRCFERMLRRAVLPFCSSEGFHPKPRLVFALSLPLGIIGGNEVVELALEQALGPETVMQSLSRQAPPGLEFLSAMRVDPRAKAHVRSAGYRVAIGVDRAGPARARAEELLAAGECWMERTRPEPRRVNIGPYLRSIRVGPELVEFHLWVTPNGTARPDEVLRALGLGDLHTEGAVIERFLLEIDDELALTENTAAVPALAAGNSA
jgi:radical SAM-linked protein